MTRVLVLGAEGLLGTSLVRHLRAEGHDVLRHARQGDVDIRGDLTEPVEVSTALDEASSEVVINLAALTNVDDCERDPQRAYLANVRIVENIARWMRTSGGAPHLIQISTDQVYDGAGTHSENDVTLSNYYGFSKYAGELAAALVSSTVLRTNFFGPSRRPGRTSLSDWLVMSLRQQTPITVFDDVRFSPLSIARLAELIELVVVRRTPGVFNLGSRDGMSKADFAFAIADALALPTPRMKRGTSRQVKLTAYRPSDMRMDSSRFECTFRVELPSLAAEIQSMKAAYSQ
jgi:dTDP-4-dehydrorhamnose reductase